MNLELDLSFAQLNHTMRARDVTLVAAIQFASNFKLKSEYFMRVKFEVIIKGVISFEVAYLMILL